jgi:integrase
MSDRRYLEWHGKQWRVQLRVPPRLQPVMGRKRLTHPLHTGSLANANRLKWDVVAKLKAIIRAAEKGLVEASDHLTDEALRWREDLAKEKPRTIEFWDHSSRELVEADEYILPDLLVERAEEIEAKHGLEVSANFFRVAKGEATPIGSLVDLWLTERADMKPRQRTDYRRAVTRFAQWSPVAIEGVNRKVAGRYISEEMVAKGKHPRTSNKDISCLSAYWKWLVKRGHADINPWQGQSLPKKLAGRSTKRPFTDGEVRTLLSGTADTFLLDLMKTAAASGMRLEEIASLKVRDVTGGIFNVRDAKTAAGLRKLPIHSELAALVQRRTRGKADGDFLFEEMGGPRLGVQERGQKGTKRFITYRRRLGIEEKGEDQRQSNIDFHSFRRWFIQSARNALQDGAKGYDPWTIAEVVGHDTKSGSGELAMTMGGYPGPQTLMAKRACVEAVKLPERSHSTVAPGRPS